MTAIHANPLKRHWTVSSHYYSISQRFIFILCLRVCVCILLNTNSGGVKAIVADVIMGYYGKNQTKQPIIHQKNNQSDFSLDEFITQTIQFHAKNKNHAKIIKLNFGSFDAVPQSITILLAKQREVSHYNRIAFYLDLRFEFCFYP